MKVAVCVTIAVMLVGFIVSRPVKAELMFHYDFESADLEDASGNNNVAEVKGDPQQVNGSIGMGFRFDGEEDHFLAAGEGGVGLGPLVFMHEQFAERSTALWVKADDVNDDHIIFEQGGSANGQGMKISGGELFFSTRSGNNEVTITAPYLDTDWHHVAGVFNAGTLLLYIDGEEVATIDAPYQQVPAHAGSGMIGVSFKSDVWGLEINAALPPVSFFKGVMDEIYYYSNALTDREINNLYQQGAAVEPGDKLTATWSEIKSSS